MVGEAGMPGTVTSNEKRDSSRDMNVANSPRLAGGPTKDVQDMHVAFQDVGGQVQEAAHEDLYGPWVLVERKKNGTRFQRSGGSQGEQKNAFAVRNNGISEIRSMERLDRDRVGVVNGPERDSKKKLVAPRKLDKAQFENATKKIGKDFVSQDHTSSNQNEGPSIERKDHTLSKQNEGLSVERQPKSKSVKGKKMLARMKMSNSDRSSAIVGEATWAEVGFSFGGCASEKIGGGLGRESRDSDVDHGAFHCEGEESMEVQLTCDGAKNPVSLALVERSGEEEVRKKNQAEHEDGSGFSAGGSFQDASSLPSVGSVEGSDQAVCMVFEGGVPC
nr:hypothetical protein CFP56_38103 [Quercus suber]